MGLGIMQKGKDVQYYGLEMDSYKNELHDAVDDAELSGCGSRRNAFPGVSLLTKTRLWEDVHAQVDELCLNLNMLPMKQSRQEIALIVLF